VLEVQHAKEGNKGKKDLLLCVGASQGQTLAEFSARPEGIFALLLEGAGDEEGRLLLRQ